jgi:enoyl-CoA hydratase
MGEFLRQIGEMNFENARALIITGSPGKAFVAGADIKEIASIENEDQAQDFAQRGQMVFHELSLLKIPVIAAVNGFALGGGCELAMSCDFIIAGDSAKFGQPEIKIGTIPGAGGTQRLTRAIGKSKAMLAVLTGEPMNAYEAEKAGLVAKVVPAETLLQETFEIAKIISNRAPVAVKLAKEAVNMAFESSLKDGMEYERRNFYLTFSSRDQKEGMKAFMEKREPKYEGN